jgi:ElaB/YqjD/DUF883 family membrane-anchored ribosome-binding protein
MADEPEPEVIREQMEAQRAALSDKLETLEHKIVETVQGAKEAVAETAQTVKETVQSSVDTVKETVSSSVETVKEAFDLNRQVDRHPWAMFGGAVAAGFAAGWLLNRAGGSSSWGAAPARYEGAASYAYPPTAARRDVPRASAGFTGTASGMASSQAPAEQGASWAQELSQTFAPEVNKLKGLAIGAVMGVVRDLVAQSVPDQLRPQLTEMMNSVTQKLGGEPVQGQLLDQILPRRDDGHNGRRRTEQEQFNG